MSTDIRQRTPQQELARMIEGDYFREQIQKALPANVTVDRFQRALLTAVMQNPDVAKADHQSIVLSAVVRDGDTFEWSEEPPTITHKPAPTGDGALVYAYAIATHKDGRRIQRVVFPHEIEARRKQAKTQNIWKQWPAEMWMKTAGHMLFSEIPLGDLDQERDRLARIVNAWEQDPSQAVDAIYGPAPVAGELPPAEMPVEGAAAALGPAAEPSGEQAGGGTDAPLDAAGSSPEPQLDDGEEPQIEFGVPALVVEQAAGTFINSQSRTLGEVLEHSDADAWVRYVLAHPGTLSEAEQSAVELVIRERRPELWAEREQAEAA
jgi:hypothetical protein